MSFSVEKKERDTKANSQMKEEKEEGSNLPITKFTWIRRQDEVKRGDHSIDFPDRNYRVPLIGCSNLERNLEVGDIVSVIWKSSILEKRRFDVRCECFSEELLKRGGSFGSFYRKEEHFFQIHRKLTKSKFTVSEIFIHGSKVIRKEIDESFTRNQRVDTSLLIPEKLLSYLLEGLGVLPDKEVSEPFKSKIKQGKDSWESFSAYRAKTFIEKFHILLRNTQDSVASASLVDIEAMKKDLLRKLPYHDYRKTIFALNQENVKEDLRSFCIFLEGYAEDFIRIFGEKLFHCLGGYTPAVTSGGIYEKVIKHMEELIQEMLSSLSPRITLSVDNYLYLPCALETARIRPKNSISALKLSQIFRVYRNDPRFCMKSCSTVTDWCGILLPPTIRSELQPGDHVRVLISDRVEDRKEDERIQEERMKLIEKLKKEKESDQEEEGEDFDLPVIPRRCYSDRVIYFQILLHLTGSKYLASLENRYLSEYEDLILVIDSNAVSEIPLSWSENPNFRRYEKMIEDGEIERKGYTMTGSEAMDKNNYQLIDFENEIVFRLAI